MSDRVEQKWAFLTILNCVLNWTSYLEDYNVWHILTTMNQTTFLNASFHSHCTQHTYFKFHQIQILLKWWELSLLIFLAVSFLSGQIYVRKTRQCCSQFFCLKWKEFHCTNTEGMLDLRQRRQQHYCFTHWNHLHRWKG